MAAAVVPPKASGAPAANPPPKDGPAVPCCAKVPVKLAPVPAALLKAPLEDMPIPAGLPPPSGVLCPNPLIGCQSTGRRRAHVRRREGENKMTLTLHFCTPSVFKKSELIISCHGTYHTTTEHASAASVPGPCPLLAPLVCRFGQVQIHQRPRGTGGRDAE